MRTLLTLLLAVGAAGAQDKRVWISPTVEEFFAKPAPFPKATVREEDDSPGEVARFTFSVPQGCKLTVDGRDLATVDGRATVRTPPLTDDRLYQYTVRCCEPDGQCQTRVVQFKRGSDNAVTFARAARPEVRVPQTFRNPSHNCPSCGRSQYVVAGFNGDGTHTHVCPSCGTSWKH